MLEQSRLDKRAIKIVLLIFIVYWLLMMLIGFPLVQYNYIFVKKIDLTLVDEALFLYVVSFVFFILGIIFYVLSPKSKLIVSVGKASSFKYFGRLMLPIGLGVMLLFLTFLVVGYIPIFHDHPGAKYFEDAQDLYIPMRPLYTLGISILSSMLMVLLIVYYMSNSQRQKIWIAIFIFIVTVVMMLTAKRGPLFLPFFYFLLFLYIIGVGNLLKIGLIGLAIIAITGLVHSFHIRSDDSLLISTLISFSNSFFVGPRELTRALTIFDGISLYGLSYLAGFLAFIPTALFPFKSDYIFMRYLMTLEGSDPNLSGGMRAGFIAEAYYNFGFMGVCIISFLFGFIAIYIAKRILVSQYLSRYGMAKYFFLVFTLHQFYVAFFENGSAFFFHFFSKAVMFIVFMELARKKVKF